MCDPKFPIHLHLKPLSVVAKRSPLGEILDGLDTSPGHAGSLKTRNARRDGTLPGALLRPGRNKAGGPDYRQTNRRSQPFCTTCTDQTLRHFVDPGSAGGAG